MSRKYRRAVLDPARIDTLLTEVLPIGGGELPISAVGWFDAQRRPRRARADYPNGWRVEIRISAKGDLTHRSASLHLEGSVPARQNVEASSPEQPNTSAAAALGSSFDLGGSTVADSDGDDGA